VETPVSPTLMISGIMDKSVRLIGNKDVTSISDYIEGEERPTSLDNIQISQQDKWLNSLVVKEQPLHDGGINRQDVLNDMLDRGVDISIRNRFEFCCKRSIVFECENEKKRHFVYQRFHCGSKICPVCNGIREARIRERYQKGIYLMKNPKLVSVTIGHVPVNYPEVISHYRRIFYKFLRKLTKKINSGFGVLEISPGFFLHFHMIIDTPLYIPQDKLSDMWMEISGRYVVDIRRCNPRWAMSYVIKYVVKAPEFESSNHYVDYLDLTHNRRLLTTYGKLYGMKIEREKEPRLCPCCGYDLHFSRIEIVFHEFMLDYFGSLEGIP